jgi:predicted outer membrane repeat protein
VFLFFLYRQLVEKTRGILPSGQATLRRRKRWTCRPLLASLEDRLTPTTLTLTVSSPLDTGSGTLRAAIQTIDSPSSDTTFNVVFTTTGTISLNSGLGALQINPEDLSATVNITGLGSSNTIIDGDRKDRVFLVDPNRNEALTVNLSNLTITNGLTSGTSSDGENGGGILVNGSKDKLNLANAAVTNNKAKSANGGGICASGSVSLNNSKVNSNSLPDPTGGGVFLDSGFLTFQGTLLAGNTRTDGGTPDNFASLGGTATSNGYNLSDDGSTSGFFMTAKHDFITTAAGLSTTLAANSGRTKTYALPSGSAAAGTGDSSGPSLDQRALPWVKSPSDIGSF